MPAPLDQLFAALADPTRRSVIERLARGPLSVGELAAAYDMSLPSFLRHLTVLETTGILRSIKKGRVRTCHIEAAPLIDAQGWLAWQREVWEGGA